MRSAMILGILDGLSDLIQNLIGNFLYGLLGSIFFRLLDWVQSIFRALAGLSPIVIDGNTVNQNADESYDIVWHLLQTDIVQDIFWSMVTFSLILMFMMTGLAVIRNAYQDKPKPISDIISNVFKGLLGMILIPIACMVGLMFGNIILHAVDSGTGAGSSTKLSGTLFLSAAYDANIARNPFDNEKTREKLYKEFLSKTNFVDYLNSVGESEYAIAGSFNEAGWNEIAELIDNAYVTDQLKTVSGAKLDTYNTALVGYCYKLWHVNYLVLVVGGCIMLGFIFKMCFGMIGRIFKLTIDFVMIPVVMAMMPFDQKPASSWKGDFIKNTTLAYSTVGVMNIYFSILPIINKIEFSKATWGGGASGILDAILKLVLSIVGLFSAESIISSVGGWFGTGDLIKEGASVNETFKKGLKKVTDPAKKAAGGIAKFKGAYDQTKKDRADAQKKNSFWANVGGGFANTVGKWAINKANEDPILKGYRDGQKNVKDSKDAGGWHAGIHSADVQEEMKAQVQAEKDIKKLDDAFKKLEDLLRIGKIDQDEYNKRFADLYLNSNLSTNYFANKGTFDYGFKNENGEAVTRSKVTKEDYESDIAYYERRKGDADAVATFAKEMVEKNKERDQALIDLVADLKSMGIIADGKSEVDIKMGRKTKIVGTGKKAREVDDEEATLKATQLIRQYNRLLEETPESKVKAGQQAEIVSKYAQFHDDYKIEIDVINADGSTTKKSYMELSSSEREKYATEIEAAVKPLFTKMINEGFDNIGKLSKTDKAESSRIVQEITKNATEAFKKITETADDVKKFISKNK